MKRWNCLECGEPVQTASGLFCSPECHLMNARRRDNAARMRAVRLDREHRERMKGRERRLLEHAPK